MQSFLTVFLLAALAGSCAAVEVTVRTWLDANGDGQPGAGEPGVPQVLVSDGDQVVRADADGVARLDVSLSAAPVRRVHVVVPGGHRATTAWHARVEAEPAELTLNVGLQPADQATDQPLALAADPQVTAEDAGAVAARLLEELFPREDPPAFAVVLGDNTEHAAPEAMRAWREALAAAPGPLHLLYGEHDMGQTRARVETFERELGPAWHAFWSGGRCYLAMVADTDALTGREVARQAQWLRRMLLTVPDGAEVVVLSHIPPAPLELEQIRRRHRLRAVLYGHWHENSVWRLDSTLMICSGPYRGAEWGAETGSFRRVRFYADRTEATVVRSGIRHRLEVLTPSGVQPPDRLRLPLRVAAFDSRSEIEVLEARLDGGEPVALHRAAAGMWRLDLPAQPVQRLHLRATARSGDTWERDAVVPPAVAAIAADPAGPPPRPPLTRAWLASTGAHYPVATGLVYVDGLLVVGVPDENLPAEPGVVALDARAGREVWRRPTDGSVRRAVVASGGRVYALTHLNVVHAFAAADGRELWRRELTPEPPGRHRSSYAGLAWSGDRLLAQVSGGPLFALNPADGSTVSKTQIGRAYYAGAVANGTRAVVATLGGLVGVDLAGFSVAWRTPPLVDLAQHGPATLDGGLAYVVGPELWAVEAASGSVRWRQPLPFTGLDRGAAVVADGVVYAPGPRPVAWQANTGAPVWRGVTPAAGPAPASPALTAAHVFAVGDDGLLRVYDRGSGAEVGAAPLGAPGRSAPLVVGGTVYVLDALGNIHAFVSEGAR